MEETRTKKYKEYRKSILKDGGTAPFSSGDVINSFDDTTTLPFEQVIETHEKKEKFDLILFFRKNAKLFSIIAIGIGLLLIILGIILWAFKVWSV